jgi:hypothetical protein
MGVVSEAADNMHLQTESEAVCALKALLHLLEKYGFGTRHKTSVGQIVCRDC